MLSQFQRTEEEQTTDYCRRLLDTFVSSVTLSENGALVCFNLTAPGTEKAESIFVPFPENKNPAESSDSSLNSAGSTALRLVEAMGVEPALFPHAYIGRLKIRRNQAIFYDTHNLSMSAITHPCA